MSEALQKEIRHLRTLEGSDRDPRDRIFLPLAAAHLRHGNVAVAEELLREGLTRHPEFVAAHVLLARVHEARGDADEAQETWAAARRLDPDNVEAMFALGRILVARGEEVGGELVLRARAADPTAGGQEPDADLVSIAELTPDQATVPVDDFADVAQVDDVAPVDDVLAAGSGEDIDAGLAAVPVADLAPDVADDADVVSIADLAPDPVADTASLDADPGLADLAAAGTDSAAPTDRAASTDSDVPTEPDAPVTDPLARGERRVVTRTLAELLAGQGQRERAIEMYEELVARSPGDASLETRLRELRDATHGDVGQSEPDQEEEVDPRLTRLEPDPDSPTPFTWTEATSPDDADQERTVTDEGMVATHEVVAATDDGTGATDEGVAATGEAGGDEGDEEASIGDYLGGLLSYSPSRRSDDTSTP